jgi:phosphatidylglycerol:prolipoprotein diacylglycerol transferase
MKPWIVEIFGFPLRYYSMAYLLGLLAAMYLLGRLARRRIIALDANQVSDLVIPYGLLGVLLGGRLGYVLFYDLSSSLADPIRIVKIWDGGMSSHGGVAGVMIAFWLFARKAKVPFLHILDLGALTAPIGIYLGRLANFINGELYGRVTDVAWAVQFRTESGQLTEPRHPSQIYEAYGEGLIPFVLLWLLHRRLLPKTGAMSALFGIVYSLARIVSEQFREPDAHIGFQVFGTTRGQLLTLGMIAASTYIIVMVLRGKSPKWEPAPLEPAEGAA